MRRLEGAGRERVLAVDDRVTELLLRQRRQRNQTTAGRRRHWKLNHVNVYLDSVLNTFSRAFKKRQTSGMYKH